MLGFSLNLELSWNEWATLFSAVGAFGAAVSSFLGVWQNKKERIEDQRPTLAFDSREFWIVWDPESESYKQKHDGQLINIINHNLEMKAHNIGRGPAKEVNYKWIFNEGIIDQINSLCSPLVEIEKSGRDKKGRLYFYLIKSPQEYLGIIGGEISISPFGENQNDPAYLYQPKHIHYRVGGESSVTIGKNFGNLSLAYVIASTETLVEEEFDLHYKPSIDFEIEYKNNSNKSQKQKFTITCQSHIYSNENGSIDGGDKPSILLMYQVFERK